MRFISRLDRAEQKVYREADYAGGGRIKQKALGSYGLARPYIACPARGLDGRALVFMAHKSTSSSAPVLIDPHSS